MSAFTDLTDYLAFVKGPQEIGHTVKNTSGSVVAGRMASHWMVPAPTATAPTTAVACTSATTGAIGQANTGSTSNFIVAGNMNHRQGGLHILADRLSHQGGLSGTSAVAQTTNLPTAALTRYTTGAGVMMGLEIYTDIGNTAVLVSASYTNQAGTSGRTAPSVVWGGSGFNTAFRLALLPLAAGDSGVRAVASVTATASTGTVGNFGVTLFKPLLAIPTYPGVVNFDAINNMLGGMPEITSDACLQWLYVPMVTSTVGTHSSLSFAWR